MSEGYSSKPMQATKIGDRIVRVDAVQKARGEAVYVCDMTLPNMQYAYMVRSTIARGRIKAIHVPELPEGYYFISAKDIPAQGKNELWMIAKDWRCFAEDYVLYVGETIGLVVGPDRSVLKRLKAQIKIDYEEQTPAVTIDDGIHCVGGPMFPEKNSNVMCELFCEKGRPMDEVFAEADEVFEETIETPYQEHVHLETNSAIADMEDGKFVFYASAQCPFYIRKSIAGLLDIPYDDIIVRQCTTGGAFGGKEDFTCQPHAALAAYLLGRPVKVRLSRPESIRMHPKRHGMKLHYVIGCDEKGILQAAKVRIIADTGAYASAGGPVVTRTGTHATSAYHIPSVDVHVKAVFTNNLPAGAFRGFGVNQSNFAMECLIDELCEKGGFDRWQFRYDNAVAPGRMVTTGQVLGEGTALRETLLAVRDAFRSHPRAGIACAIKNSGIGNGIPEPCDCYLEVHPAPEQPAGARLVLHHGWTEMGQGINTVARQMLCEVAELGPDVAIDITASTEYGAFAGSTTASRGTFQLGHAVVNAARQLRGDLNKYGGRLDRLVGRFYKGHYDSAGQTSGQGAPGEIRNHVSYSFATHVVFMDEEGGIEKIIAAHDSGRVVNRPLYEGQVQGGVVMGMGYALTESIPVKGGYLTSGKLNACGLLRSVDVPEIEVIAVEVPDPEGPCGAKGIGEIACIPTAPAIVNALYLVDGVRRRELPVRKKR